MSDRPTAFHSSWGLPRKSLVGNPENWGCRPTLPWWRKAIAQHKAWKKVWTSSQMSGAGEYWKWLLKSCFLTPVKSYWLKHFAELPTVLQRKPLKIHVPLPLLQNTDKSLPCIRSPARMNSHHDWKHLQFSPLCWLHLKMHLGQKEGPVDSWNLWV